MRRKILICSCLLPMAPIVLMVVFRLTEAAAIYFGFPDEIRPYESTSDADLWGLAAMACTSAAVAIATMVTFDRSE